MALVCGAGGSRGGRGVRGGGEVGFGDRAVVGGMGRLLGGSIIGGGGCCSYYHRLRMAWGIQVSMIDTD